MDYSNMPLEEKRSYYQCGDDYVTLDKVLPWPDYVKENHRFFTEKGWLEEDSEGTTDNDHINRKVSLWQGDIIRLEIDAIVISVRDYDIHQAAGEGLQEEYRKLNGCDSGDAKITSGHKLPAKHVIHTFEGHLGSCYNSSLRLVKEHELSSVVFPSLNVTFGMFSYRERKAAVSALLAVTRWLEENDDWVDRIIFCVPLQEYLDMYQELMLAFFPCTTKKKKMDTLENDVGDTTKLAEGTTETTVGGKDIEEEEYRRAYSQGLHEGKAKNNRIPIMLVGQDRGGKTSLMRRLLGLPFDKDQPSTTGIDVNVIELTEQNAEDPWKKTEVKKYMTSESEAKTVLYKKTAEYLDGGVQLNLEADAPEPLKPVMQVKPVLPVKPFPVKALSRDEISKIKSQRSTEHDQDEVLRVFVSDFAGQSIYYDTHGCFVKPHCPYVLVHDLSLEFDELAVPRFKASGEEEEEEMNNPHLNTNLDHFTSWLKFLKGLGECQDQQFPDKSGHFTTAKGENFKLPPVLIALTHSDEVKGNDSKIDCVQKRINKVLSGGKYENVVPEFFVIDNTLEGDDGDDVRKLRRKLFDLSNAVLDQETLMPMKWLNFEVALSQKLSPDCKYIPVDEAKQEAEACGVGEFDQAIKFLHRQGVVVHHSGSSKVVLDPPWLMNRFTKVISVPGKLDALSRHSLGEFKQKGILFREYLGTLENAELLEELMQKFNLICPCQHDGKAAFYVPSVAPAMIPGQGLEASDVPSLFVTFPRQLVPMSLFTKLQVKLISEWKKRFPKQQATPSFYCNYSLLPLIIDGGVYDVYLIDLHEFIKVAVFPKHENSNHFKFASSLLATLKKCLDDLKSPDQLLFSMTSYDLEVKCTCCFGKEERKCSRHREIQCHSDRCGHRHFWKLSDLQTFYNDQSPAVCRSDKRSSKVFDIKSVKIWLNTVPDAAMVEDSSNFGWPNETSSEASSSGNDRIAPPPELNITLPTAKDFDSKPYDCSSNEIQSQLPTDILLITANDHEFNACYLYMKHVQRGYSTKLGMVDFGRFGDQNNANVRVALMKSRQGPTDAVIAVRNAAEILNPKVVLFVGICASMERAKAKLGDVVISAKLANYDHKKVKADGTVVYRGTKADVSKNMAHLIINAAHGWKPPLKDPKSLDVEVHHDAVMLSGSDSVNNLKRRQELLNSFPDALGLEMEGAGLYAAARDLGIEWAVIKGVSDFADGSKEKTKLWQPFASAMAASVVYNMFKYPVVLKDWRHYNAEGHT